MSDYFVPTKKIFILVTNQHYAIKRNEPGYENFADIDEVVEDAAMVKEGLKGLGARDLDVNHIIDAKHLDM